MYPGASRFDFCFSFDSIGGRVVVMRESRVESSRSCSRGCSKEEDGEEEEKG